MKYRVWGCGIGTFVLVLALVQTGSAQAQETADTDTVAVQEAFADQHIDLDLDGIQPPWLGRVYPDQRINWTLDSTNILRNSLQNEWKPQFSGTSNGVFLYQIMAGDTTGIPIAFDYDTYRMIKAEQNTLADWQISVQNQLRLRDAQKARDLVAISLPFELPKAVTSIVGEGGAGLKVNGFKRINFSGRSQWRDGPQVSNAMAQSKFPSLDMEQITQMTITGKIGSKIEVKVDQDSRRVTDLGNRIQIRYNGFEDEIIQTIEAGNTNLSLPNTQFVGYSQRVQGLFGVKTTAKIGHLNLTAIASQEKGSTEGATFRAGAKGEQSYIRDHEYLRNRYFWLWDPFNPDSSWTDRFVRGDSIIAFKLYKTAGFETQATEPQALCLPLIPPDLTIDDARPNPDSVYSIYQVVDKLQIIEETDYYFDPNQFWFTIYDNNPIGDQTLLGVYMEIQTPTGIDTLGEIRSDSTASPDSISLLLTLIKSDTKQYPGSPTWDLEWKNVYDLRARDIKTEGLEVDIYLGRRGTETQEGQNLNNQDGTTYLEIFGLDRTATDGSPVPDGIIDDDRSILDRSRGHLIFPNSYPFAPTQYPDTTTSDTIHPILGDRPTYAQDGTKLAVQAPEIYYGKQAVNRQEKSQYYLAVTTTERQTSYSLGRVNILEGSESVKLNGQPLTRGVDYTIMYELGRIDFLSDAALDPNANVTVDYEYEPFFTVDRKTLFGIRGEYQPSQNFKWGATALFKSEKQPDNQRPRLGEEPSRTLIWDTDFGFRTSAPFLTKLTDALPLVEAEAPSNIDVQAEVAQSLPNPNTRDDVYIDDFEASQEIVSLPLFREAWTQASPPANNPNIVVSDLGNLTWYNRFDPYRITEIYNKDETPAEDRTQVLSVALDQTSAATDWNGVQRAVSTGLQNLSNTQYIELRVQGQSGTLVFDMGEISEDINSDGILDTEDSLRNNFSNGVLDEDEDRGLDGLFNRDEPGYNAETNRDPNGDDWFYSQDTKDDYSRINGTEGNRPDPIRGWLPDTEDLNGNNSLDVINSYFEYEIDLSDANDPFLVQNSEFPLTPGDEGPWRTYRIPINDTVNTAASRIVGSPRLISIRYMRLYLTGVPQGERAQVNIADMSLVSYRWRDVRIVAAEDSSQDFRVSVVNTRENSDYRSPPGVDEVVDRVTLIGQGEQSLLLGYSDLQPFRAGLDTVIVVDTLTGDTALQMCGLDTCIFVDTSYADLFDEAMVSQTLLASQDYTGYRRMQMYVGDPGFATADGNILFFLRFGSDTLNFYEYQTTIDPGSAEWNEANYVDVDFNDLTGFKFNVQQGLTAAELRAVDTTAPPYRIKGNPSLSRIEYLEMGVANRDPNNARSGQIWVNELRLTDVRKDAGLAARFSVSANFSDFGGASVSYRAQNYAFTTLTAGRTNIVNSSSQENINVTARFSPHKILPRSWPLQVPVSLTWGRSKSTPYFITRSDIVVPQNAREEEATKSERKGLTMSARYAKPTGNILERYLLIPFNMTLSYSHSASSSPTVFRSESQSYTSSASYALSFQKPASIPLLYFTRLLLMPRSIYGTRFTLFPTRFSASGNYSKRVSGTRHKEFGTLTQSQGRDFRGVFSLAYTPITNLSLDYNYSTQRDLRDASTVNFTFNPSEFRLGVETSFNSSYRTSYVNRWIPFLEQRYSYDVGYRETLERQTDNTRSLTSTRNFQASYGLTWVRLFGRPNPEDRWLSLNPYIPARKLVRGIFNLLDPLSFSYGRNLSIRGYGYEERPQWPFVFGLTTDPDAEQTTGATFTQRDARGLTNSLSARSGLNLFGARITLAYSLRRQENNNSSNRTLTQSQSFPTVRVTFSDLTKIGLIRALANSATLESAFDMRHDYTQPLLSNGDPDGPPTTESDDIRFNPLIGLSLNWRGNISTQFKVDKTFRETGQPSSATAPRSKSEDDGVQASIRYAFSAPGGIRLPFLRGLKLSSTLNLTAAVSWTRSRSWQKVGNGQFELRSERSTFSVAPQAGYSFSQTLTGGFRARWQDTNDKIQQSNTHVRELGFWVEFRF